MTTRLLVLIGVLSAVTATLVVLLVLALDGVIQTSDHASQVSQDAIVRSSLAHEESQVTKEIASAIQNERRRSTLEGCRAQDRHHRVAVQILDKLLLEGRHLKRGQRKRARGAVQLVVQALAPLEDCQARAANVLR